MRYAALLLVFAISLAAQDSRFDVRSRLVLAPVTVTDAEGHLIDDLETSEFRLLDNGRERKVTVDFMSTGVAPIALAVAVQSSGISIPVLEKVRKIGGMIQPLITGERGCAALVSFAESVTWLQDCTSDSGALEQAFRNLQPGEHKKARMVDAVNASIERLRERPNARRVLLLISESRDRGSETELQTATAAAQSAGVTVYAATYSALKTAFTSKSRLSDPPRKNEPESPPERARDVMGSANGAPASKYNPKMIPKEQRVDVGSGIGELARLAKTNTAQALTWATGGAMFPFTRQRGLEDAIAKLGAELHTQYVLSFAPDDAAAGYHSIEVQVTRAGELRVRTRPGYWTDPR